MKCCLSVCSCCCRRRTSSGILLRRTSAVLLPSQSFLQQDVVVFSCMIFSSFSRRESTQPKPKFRTFCKWVGGFALPETFFGGTGLRLLMDRSQTLKPLPHPPPSKQERPLELRKRRILQKNSREKRESGNKCKPCMVVEPGCGIQDESGIRNRRRRFLALHRPCSPRRCRISISVSVCPFSSVHTVLSRETREDTAECRD